MKTQKKTTEWFALTLIGLLALAGCGGGGGGSSTTSSSTSSSSSGSTSSSTSSGSGSTSSSSSGSTSSSSSSGSTSSSSSGAPLPWTGIRQLGVAGLETYGYSVATDADGSVYVAGNTNGGLDGNTLVGDYDFFVTRYDSSGIKQYTRQLGVTGESTFGYSVATDPLGNVYVAGDTSGGLDGNTLTGITDFFVTKYDSSGVKQYTRQLGVSGEDTLGNSVATDASGNVYVTGVTYGGLDGNTLTGNYDLFVTKYDNNGVKQYTRQLGVASENTYGNSVAADADGNVYVAGSTTGALDGNTLTGSRDFFVTKYDRNGVKQYTRQLGVASESTYGNSVATDADGNVYVAGATFGGLDGNTGSGYADFFVTKYDRNGVKQYTRQIGVAGAVTRGYSVATDANRNVYVAGETSAGLDGNTLTGIRDFFVIKYDSSGIKQYTRQLGVAGTNTVGNSIATDTDGNVFVAGFTTGGLDGNTLMGLSDFFVTKYDSAGVKQ